MQAIMFPTCALCRDAPSGSVEHIVPESLGGRRTVTNFICGRCNNLLGKKVDAVLEEDLRMLTQRAGNVRGDGRAPAPVRNLRTTSGREVSLHADGQLVVEDEKPFDETELPGGNVRVRVSAPTVEAIAKLLTNALIRYDLDVNRLYDAEFARTAYDIGALRINFQFGKPDHARSVAKMGLAAVCDHLGASTVRDSRFFDAAAFARGGPEGHERRRYMLNAEIRHECREHVGISLGSHALLVFNSPRTAECIFLAFGALPYRVRLADAPLAELKEGAILHRVHPRLRKHEVLTVTPPEYARSFAFENRHAKRHDEACSKALDEIIDAFPSPTPSKAPHPTQDAVQVADLVEAELKTKKHRKPISRDELIECARRILLGPPTNGRR